MHQVFYEDQIRIRFYLVPYQHCKDAWALRRFFQPSGSTLFLIPPNFVCLCSFLFLIKYHSCLSILLIFSENQFWGFLFKPILLFSQIHFLFLSFPVISSLFPYICFIILPTLGVESLVNSSSSFTKEACLLWSRALTTSDQFLSIVHIIIIFHRLHNYDLEILHLPE